MSNKDKCKESEKEGKINFKSSKSILDAIKALFKIPNISTGSVVNSQLLAYAGNAKPGLSAEKIASRIIRRKSEAGLPVGPLVGGNLAPDEIMEKIRIEEIVRALTTEARIDVSTQAGTQLQATGANYGGPIQVIGTTINTANGYAQMS